MEYIDTHCHLDLEAFDADRDAVIDRACKAGVGYFINPGINIHSCRKILELAKQYTQIKPVIGIHPNDLGDHWKSDLLELEELSRLNPIYGIGEIGLDKYHQDVSIEIQIEAFVAQLDLACQLKLPVVIHCREAIMDIFPILEEYSSRPDRNNLIGVMHSFEGTIEQAHKFIYLGFMIGIGGPVTYKNAHVKHELAAGLPIESMLLETDSPFLTPAPYRGTRNEPVHIPQIGKRTAIIRGCTESTIQSSTTSNANKLFCLGVHQ